MQKPSKRHKVYLCNTQTLGAMCGYGTGPTREEAIEAALAIAKQRDPNAYYDRASSCVCFAGGVNC